MIRNAVQMDWRGKTGQMDGRNVGKVLKEINYISISLQFSGSSEHTSEGQIFCCW